MIYTLVYRPKVKWDIQDAFDYYKTSSLRLPNEFLFRIKEATTHILRNPLGFQIKYEEVRTASLKQFPYQIHYIFNSKKHIVTILAVIHSQKNPTDYSVR